MKSVYAYLLDYIRTLDKRSFLFTSLFLAVLVTLNYTIGIDRYLYSNDNRLIRFTGYFFLFLLIFSTTYLIVFLSGKEPVPSTSFFYLLLFVTPAIFAIKMSLVYLPDVTRSIFSFPSFDYWKLVLHWPMKAMVITLLVLLIWRYGRYDPPLAGMEPKPRELKPYWILLLMMIPLLFITSSMDSFAEVYPKVKNVYFIEDETTLTWPFYLFYEFAYGIDFFTIELFFRGLLVLGFVRYVGKNAILPMAAFYCAIHFGKPLAECITSYFGGLILGVIVYNTRSVWGGLVIHLGIAWLMEGIGIGIRILNFRF